MTRDLERIYRDYIDTLNERRFEQLDQFVHDHLVYNDAAITREQYVAMLVDDVRAIPDLHYEIDLLRCQRRPRLRQALVRLQPSGELPRNRGGWSTDGIC